MKSISEYAKNPETCAIINNPVQDSKFEWKNDILWYKGRIYLSSQIQNLSPRFLRSPMIHQQLDMWDFSRPTTMHVNPFFGRG
jgi:hypothetical protein